MPRLLPSFAALAALGLASPVLAEELTPQRLATVQHDEEKALEKVNKAHGDKKPSEMSPEERREVMQEQQAAKREVLEKNNVDLKEYVTRGSRLSREEKAEVEATRKSIQAKEEADQRAAAEKPPEEPQNPTEVIIRKGLGEEDPVDISDTDEFDEAPPEGDGMTPSAPEDAPPAEKPPPPKKKAAKSKPKPKR